MNTTPNEAIVEACAHIVKQTPFHLRAQITDILSKVCMSQYMAGYRDGTSALADSLGKVGAE